MAERAKFTIQVDDQVSQPANKAADAVSQLQAQLKASQEAAKAASAQLRNLKGSTEEVATAKAELKAKLNAEQAAISKSQVELLKLQKTQKSLAETQKKQALEAKEAADFHAKMHPVATKVSAALSMARNKWQQFTASLTSPRALEAVKTALVGITAAIAAAAAAAAGAAIAFGKWLIESANAERTQNLVREAATGSAESARNLGDQIDVLAGKVSLSREKLNEMAVALAKTRLSGNLQVETLNAIAQASDAMGDEVGNTLKNIVTRSQLTKRMFISPQELFGTGLEFTDVASALADQLHVGVKQAQMALFQGRVKLDDGAKALRAAVEKRFSSVNARKLLDIGTMANKAKEALSRMTRDVNLEPLLKGAKVFFSIFDESTVTGASLKQLITFIGNKLAKAFEVVGPIAKKFVQGLIIGGLLIAIAFLKVKKQLDKTFGADTLGQIDMLNVALKAGVIAATAIAGGLLAVYVLARLVAVAAEELAKPWIGLIDKIREAWGKGWVALGEAVVSGIVEGIENSTARAVKGIANLAGKIKDSFTSKMQIKSPSKVFAKYGQQTAEGYAQGVEGGSKMATSATANLGSAPPAGGRGGGGGGIVVNLTVEQNINGGGDAKSAAAAVRGTFAELVRMIEEATITAGVPVQGGV